MQTFVRQHEASIHGVLSGFDRIRFRGTLRSISFADGFFKYLCFLGVLLKAFAALLDGTSRKLKSATERLAKATPVGKVLYLSGTPDKQQVVDDLIRKHRIPDDFTGLIAVLSCVENCNRFELHKNADAGKLQVQSAFRKCLHCYLYLRHPRFGRMHVRIMTWFPMKVQVCLNGREWLARQLDAAAIGCERRDNRFAQVADFTRAQALLDEQMRTDWPKTLSELLREVHPEFERLRAAACGCVRLRAAACGCVRACSCATTTGRRNRRRWRPTWHSVPKRSLGRSIGVCCVMRTRICRAPM